MVSVSTYELFLYPDCSLVSQGVPIHQSFSDDEERETEEAVAS